MENVAEMWMIHGTCILFAAVDAIEPTRVDAWREIESLLYALPPVQGCMTGRRMALAMMSRHMSEQHMYLRLLFW